MNKIALAIHGGAGTIRRSKMTGELEKSYLNGLEESLKAGWKILQNGGSSLEAVEASVIILEDIPLFNAGKGSVFTNEETNEMDAAIMDGKSLEAGAVAAVKNIKNPIKLARLVLKHSEHILLEGSGAKDFAEEHNVEFESDQYFFTELRFEQLQKAKLKGRIQLDHTPDEEESKFEKIKSKIGTVGAVACDENGDLAAATSTGGMTNKKFGRIGDTPIIGAGTYADNKTCAVSCTGHGEYFMKAVTAFDVSARMKYKGLNLKNAGLEAIEYLSKIGGDGGLIAVDQFGNIALPFNSEGMYRGSINADSGLLLDIYSKD